MRSLAILQSNYLPWKGYFDIIHDVDRFIFYDDLQYTKNDWRNRNRIKTQHGAEWITIPVGEDANRLVAQDARVGEGVMMTSYVKETDEEMRQKSNRTFHRIRASLPVEVAKQFGYDEEAVDPLKKELAEATAAGNWDLVVRLGAELARRNQRAG